MERAIAFNTRLICLEVGACLQAIQDVVSR